MAVQTIPEDGDSRPLYTAFEHVTLTILSPLYYIKCKYIPIRERCLHPTGLRMNKQAIPMWVYLIFTGLYKQEISGYKHNLLYRRSPMVAV
jgi:hypothetical protein